MNNQQGPPIQHRHLCSVLCGSLDGRGVWERMDTCIHMAESLHCPPETITTLFISYTHHGLQPTRLLHPWDFPGKSTGVGCRLWLYLKWIINKDLLYSTWNSAQCYVAAWLGGEFGKEWIHVYVWLSPFAVPLK